MSVTTESFASPKQSTVLAAASEKDTGRAAARLEAERDLGSMRFAEVLQRQEDLRQSVALSHEEFAHARDLEGHSAESESFINAQNALKRDTDRLSGFVDAVRDSKHAEYFEAFTAREVEAVEAERAAGQQSMTLGYVREIQRQVFDEAMAEMAEQLERPDAGAAALRDREQFERSLDPNSEPTQDAIRDRKAAEFAEMAAEQGMTPAQYAEALTRDDFGVQSPRDLAAARQRNDLDRDGVQDQVAGDYDGADEIADAAYAQLQRDRAEHVVAPEDIHVSAEEMPSVAGDYDGADEIADAAYAQLQRDRAEHVVAPEDIHVSAEDMSSEARWTVQAKDPEKGVFVDVLATSSALEAHEAMRMRSGSDARVLDNSINDYAAEWQRSHPNALGEIHFHGRSDFQQTIEAEARVELQGVVDKRADLQARVDQATESVSVAVDQVRDDTAPIDRVQQGYAQAAMAYAAAKRDLEAHEAQPSTSPIVTGKFRELQDAENEAGKAREAAAHGRIDGQPVEQTRAAEAALTAAQARVAAFAEREGVRLPPTPERASNEIEAGLTPEQIKRLTEAPRQGQAMADLDRNAQQAAAAAKPSIGTAQNEARDHSAFADAAARDKLVPEDVATAYRREGEKYLDPNDPKRVAFVDKGNRLQTVRTFDDKAVSDMIQTADARGWSEIKVSGDEAFRRKAWIEATARGIEVKGYDPTEKDKARAEALGKQTGHANAIEENEALKAYRAARDGDGKAKREAAREHPELVAAFALEKAAASFAKQRLQPDSVDRFVDQTRRNIEKSLAAGEKIPEVRRREEQEQKRAAELSR